MRDGPKRSAKDSRYLVVVRNVLNFINFNPIQNFGAHFSVNVVLNYKHLFIFDLFVFKLHYLIIDLRN